MTYVIHRSDVNKPDFQLEPLEINSTLTSLLLHGRGAKNYGVGQQQNFVRLLESFASSIAPEHPIEGQLWFDTGTDPKVLRVYNQSSGLWQLAAKLPTGQPSNPVEGDLWYDTSTDQLRAWDGAIWKPVSAPYMGTTAPVTGLTKGQTWYDTANNQLKAYDGIAWFPVALIHETIPTNPITGQVWYDASSNEIKAYNGSEWIVPKAKRDYAAALIFS